MFYSHQKGSTMLEAMAAIAVISVLTVSVIKLIGTMFNSFKQNMIENEIREVQKNIVNRYRIDGDYLALENITAEKVAEEQLVPSQMAVGNKIIHRLNGNVVINVSDLGEQYFDIRFEELPTRTCVGLSQINWNNSGTTDLFRIIINEKEYKLPIPSNNLEFGDEGALPITVKKAVESCNKGSDNTITWTFQ